MYAESGESCADLAALASRWRQWQDGGVVVVLYSCRDVRPTRSSSELPHESVAGIGFGFGFGFGFVVVGASLGSSLSSSISKAVWSAHYLYIYPVS